MNLWFECKVVYRKTDDKGNAKKVTEKYLVEAINFAEAEEIVSNYLAPFINGDFNVSGISKASINEIFHNNEGDKWYKFKVSFISVDPVSAKETKTNSNMLVLGTDIQNALDNLIENMKDTMSDYIIVSATETALMDVIPFVADNEVARRPGDQTQSENPNIDTETGEDLSMPFEPQE